MSMTPRVRTPTRVRALRAGLLASGLLSCLALTAPGSASAATTCNLYASPSGHGSGTLASPLNSVAALDHALTPGRTGCLESGTYGSMTSSGIDLTNSGTAGAPITITAAPGQSPEIVGLVDMAGNYTVLSGLTIDGSNTDDTSTHPGCPAPVSSGFDIDGHDDTFENNNLFQSVASLRSDAMGVGWSGQADNTVIRDNRIHDAGQCSAFDHLIYVAHGNNVQIYDNWLYDDPAGWGVQLYPGPTNARVYSNVVDNVGSGFVIGGGSSVSGNEIYNNIVTNPTGLASAGVYQGVGLSTCCGVGAGNEFFNNDVVAPGGVSIAQGVAVTGNVTVAPNLANPAAHDYRLTSASPALLDGWNLWDGGLGSLTAAPAAPVPSAPAPPATPVGASPAPSSSSLPVKKTRVNKPKHRKAKAKAKAKATHHKAKHHKAKAAHRKTKRHKARHHRHHRHHRRHKARAKHHHHHRAARGS